ncbi:MAG: 30S ribosomal protein S3 [Candidatus Woesearchaeota archaeon]
MIERKAVAEKIKEYRIQEYISENLRNSGHSHTKVQRTPLGEKIIIYASRPGLIVGRKGQNIKKLTSDLKNLFDLENPQLEISEVENVNLDSQIVAERIGASLERYGSARFKGVVHKVLQDVMGAGALGVEIVISGKVPSTRAKSWRFYQGYLKKCGDISLTGVDRAHSTAQLKSGIIGIKVRIMPKTTELPDDMEVSDELINEEEEIKEEEDQKTGKGAKKTGQSRDGKEGKKNKGKAAEKTKKEKADPEDEGKSIHNSSEEDKSAADGNKAQESEGKESGLQETPEKEKQER